MEKTIVLIDNGYLAVISKHLGNGQYLKFDLNQFAITLAKTQNLWCDGVYLYTAPPFQGSPPTTDETERKAKYDTFVNRMSRIPNFHGREGRLQKVDGRYQQKSVDTLLVMDLFSVAIENKTDIRTIILLACDTDFVPVLEKVRKAGIKVILFYYSDFQRKSKFSMSNHILTACDTPVLLNISHFQKAIDDLKNRINYGGDSGNSTDA